jgi:hypothetical protein
MPRGALPSALKWTEAASNSCCNCEAPMVWSFDTLRHLTVTCILKTKRHRTYVLQYFQLAFLTRNHTMQSLCANFVSLCICTASTCMKCMCFVACKEAIVILKLLTCFLTVFSISYIRQEREFSPPPPPILFLGVLGTLFTLWSRTSKEKIMGEKWETISGGRKSILL